MSGRTTVPYTYHVYRSIITLLVLLPVAFFVFGLFGIGPFNSWMAGPEFAVKMWFVHQTGIWL